MKARNQNRMAQTKASPSSGVMPRETKDSTARYDVFINDLSERISNARGAGEETETERLRIEIECLQRNLSLLHWEVDDVRKPLADDRVQATAAFKCAVETHCLKFYGKVIGVNRQGYVNVSFNESEGHDMWDNEACEILESEFSIHASYMDWDERNGKWTFEIAT